MDTGKKIHRFCCSCVFVCIWSCACSVCFCVFHTLFMGPRSNCSAHFRMPSLFWIQGTLAPLSRAFAPLNRALAPPSPAKRKIATKRVPRARIRVSTPGLAIIFRGESVSGHLGARGGPKNPEFRTGIFVYLSFWNFQKNYSGAPK